ncbi:HAD-IC family P-type ATPase [Micromonospora sp. NBC_00898]|uniref:HAD-IC family P-type ATPase n=1 Tax=Micromonospora sp. NBC_00898 TaxID=2975981 RepID=UPI0038651A22|nr:HAD-IC family P-type ATPase [Micromonospora sp. NBC_00898]
MAITAVSLVVAAVPESLPAVVTLALALGARRMAAARAIPRRLHAVETLGSVTVVASDKTGTLTEGRMAVQQAVTADGSRYVISGTGYEPAGGVHHAGRRVSASTDLTALARAVLLCNDATLAAPTPDRPEWTAVGDPLEAALVTFAARCGLAPHSVRAAWPRLAEHPFEQATRRMTTVHRAGDGRYLVICKGAPENVLADPAVAVDGANLAAAHDLAGQGLRVLAVAAAVVDAMPDPARPTAPRPLGLVAVGDPIRGTAPATADAFEDAGIRLVLITVFMTDFAAWYNEAHRHAGIGLHTPAEVHHGRHHTVRATREQALATARAAHPERFGTHRLLPKILDLPDQVWINNPDQQTELEPLVA